MKRPTYYKSFRFFLHVPETEEVLSVASVYHDLFVPGVWMEKGHVVGERTLKEVLQEATQVDVYLCSWADGYSILGHHPLRRIRIGFDQREMEWFPIDLDAESSDVARERVLLRQAVYTQMENILPDELVPALHKDLSRRWMQGGS
jgi:hypothetical protein